MAKLKRYVTYYVKTKTASLQARMLNPADFLLYIFCELILQSATVIFFWALFENIPELNGWSRDQVLMFYGMFQLSYGLFGFLFYGLYDFGAMLANGDFDGVLMRPIGSLFQMLCRGMGDIGGLALGGALLVYGAVKGVIAVSWLHGAVLLGALLCAVVLYACIYALIAATSFWMEQASGSLLRLLAICSDFARYPLDIYSRSIKALLTWALPLGFLGFYPVSFLMGGRWASQLIWLPLVTAVFMALTALVWRLGLKRYRGSGN